MDPLLELLEHENGVLPRRDHRSLSHRLDHARRRGLLQATLPAIYTAPDPTWETRIRAAAAFRPGCVITGAAAARLLWWPTVPIGAVSAAVPNGVRGDYPHFVWERRQLPPELVVDRYGLRIAAPAASILDLVPTLGGNAIDEGLRRGAVGLAELWSAFRAQPNRALNQLRAELLRDSCDEPWSEAERDAHRLLRQARIVGWRTNYRIVFRGKTHYADIAFPSARVIVEIDGFAHHGTKRAFVEDRWRLSRFAAANWRVLSFAATALDEDPEEFIALVRLAVGQ